MRKEFYLLPLIGALLLLVFLKNYLSTEIMNFLSYLFIILFILAIFIFKKNFYQIKSYFPKIKKKTFLILGLILILAIVSRFLFPNLHTFVPDDYWLMEQGKNFVLSGQNHNCVYSPTLEQECFVFKSVGLTTLESIPMLIFGFDNYFLMYFNALLSIFGIVAIFFAVLFIFKNERVALWSAFILTISMNYLHTSSHVEDIILGILFFILMVLFYFIYDKNSKQGALAVIFFTLMTLTRFEYALFCFIPGVIYLKKFLSNKNIRLSVVVSFSFLVLLAYLMLFQALVVQTSTIHLGQKINPYSQNEYFSLEENINNIESIPTIFDYKILIPFLFLAISGIVFAWRKNKLLVLMAFNSLVPLYLFLSDTSPHFKETILIIMICLLFYVGLSIDYFISKLKIKIIILYVLIGLSIILFLSATIRISNYYETETLMQLDTAASKWLNKQNISDDCYVITERPAYIAGLTTLKGIRTSDIINRAYLIDQHLSVGNCLLFFENKFCYQNRGGSPTRTKLSEDFINSIGRCDKMKFDYKLSEISTMTRGTVRYKLFKIESVK